MLLVLLLIAILPLKQHPLWAGFVGDLTVIKYVGGTSAVYAGVHLFRRRRLPAYTGTLQARLYLSFTVLAFISYVFTRVQSPITSNSLLTLISLLLLYFVLLTVIDSAGRLRWAVLANVGALAFASLYVIREWQKYQGWATGHRPGWVVGDSNHFGVSALSGIMLAWYMAQQRTSTWERWFYRGCLVLTVGAVVLGGSRGGFLGLGAAMLYAVLRSRRRVRHLVLLSVLVLGFNLAYPRSPLQRLLHPTIDDAGSSEAHRASWEAGLKMVLDHPVAGVGIGAFKSRMQAYQPGWYEGPAFMAHNAYISVAAEMGIPGLLLFASTLAATYFSLERSRRGLRLPHSVRQTAAALQAALVGSSVSIAFISAEYHQHLWLIVFLAMCVAAISKRITGDSPAARRSGDRWTISDADVVQTSTVGAPGMIQ